MGVNGLWPALDEASKPVAAEDLRGKVLAVDLSIWLVEACTSRLLMRHGPRRGRARRRPRARGGLRRVAFWVESKRWVDGDGNV